MADTENKTETEATEKPETAAEEKPKAKSKAKAKTKPKAKAKPKSAAKTKEKKAADVAPYKKAGSDTGSSGSKTVERKSSSPVMYLIVIAVLVLLTIYKFNDERSDQSVQAEKQEHSIAESTAAAENTAVTKTQTSPVQAADSSTAAALVDQSQETVTSRSPVNRAEITQQRRQALENERQSRRQQYQASMSARRQEMAKAFEAQRAEFQRMRQNQQETRMKVDALQEQIFELHEKIHQLLLERHAQQKP